MHPRSGRSVYPPGTGIAVLQVNTDSVIETYFAAAKLDAVFVPLNFRARADEVAYMVNDSGPKALLVGDRYMGYGRDHFEPSWRSVERLIAMDEPREGWLSYANMIEETEEEDPVASVGRTTICRRSCSRLERPDSQRGSCSATTVSRRIS